MTVSADLDRVQARLHDDETLWTRAELLRLYNDGYRALLAQSGTVRRWRPTDLPGRHTFGITQEWEAASAARGTVRKPTFAMLAEAYQGTSQWEIEAIEGITPTTSLGGHTQEWERAYREGDSDLHFRFSFPRNHERVVRLEWQNRKLHPVGVRELDDSDSRWFAQIGEPRWWTTGTGRVRSVELYEIATAYHQAYAIEATPQGLARAFSGARTWAAEAPFDPPNAYAYTSSADVPTRLHGLGSRVTRYAGGYSAATLATINLIQNGTFTTNITGWTEIAATVGWLPAGTMALVGTSGRAVGEQRIPTLIGRTYVLSVTALNLSKPAYIQIGTGSDGAQLARVDFTANVAYQVTVVASTSQTYIGFVVPDGFGNVDVDDVSVYQAAVADDFGCIHPWEPEVLSGATTFTASVTIATYTWEQAHGGTAFTLAVGQPRSVSSTGRQYLPITSDATLGIFLGRIMDWRSSEDSVFALEVVVPDADLVDADTPTLIPAPMTKYLRYFVLARAFGRPGEGRQPVLADFYSRRFLRGVDLFRAMGDVARNDRTFQRQEAVPSRTRPAYVRLPSTYPSIW